MYILTTKYKLGFIMTRNVEIIRIENGIEIEFFSFSFGFIMKGYRVEFATF